MEEIRVDMREMNEKDMALYARHEELLFKLNQTESQRRRSQRGNAEVCPTLRSFLLSHSRSA